MTTTFPPPSGPSLEHAFIRLPTPANNDGWRSIARPRSWYELTPVITPHVVLPASVGNRICARLIDLFVYGGPIALVAALAMWLMPRDADGLPAETAATALVIATPVVLAVVVVYLLLRSVARDGATVGRQARRIVVVDANTQEAIGWGRAVVRGVVGLLVRALVPVTYLVAFHRDGAPEIAMTAFVCAVLVNVLDIAWMFGDPHRQTFHDKAARSIVVRG